MFSVLNMQIRTILKDAWMLIFKVLLNLSNFLLHVSFRLVRTQSEAVVGMREEVLAFCLLG